MQISEIFYSIQGEGKLTGIPSVFIRVTGCNLRCSWCDTPYASWNAGGGQGNEMTIPQIMSEVMKYRPSHIVLTGGEPMMFNETVQLIRDLKNANLHVTLETAGTLWLADLPPIDLGSISPKLSNSSAGEKRINPDVLRKFATSDLFLDRQWKFVITHERDISELQELIKPLNIAPSDILLMPEGTDPVLLADRSRWLVELCKHHNYRFCPRLHVQLYGNKRGI
ncbi:MAG: 7-carboxy-7-deazaguanine synthase QueE [Phycisphaerales bacterium]|nr:7-carboxy-7-deazaguanine synthase QueE [Phycisphaerales bacterium]